MCADDYHYELGYNQSYCLVIFLNCLLFSTLVPIIPIFACLYFSIKYRVDKYNLIFTYFTKYESGGRIKKCVRNLMMFNFLLYSFVIVSFFGYKFPRSAYYWVGLIFLCLWIGAYVYLRKNWSTHHVKQGLMQLRFGFRGRSSQVIWKRGATR